MINIAGFFNMLRLANYNLTVQVAFKPHIKLAYA
jgi:hypothetical protein